MSYPLRFPSTLLVVAPSFSGKTRFILDLIEKRNSVYNCTVDNVYYVYAHYQEVFNEFQKRNPTVQFIDEIPINIGACGKNNILVLDDMLLKYDCPKKSKELSEWFVASSHHKNTSVICTWQHLFPKHLKIVSSNASYYVLFPMKRDKSTLDILNRQLFPEHPGIIRASLNEVEKVKYSYLLIDCTAESHFPFRLRNFVYPKKDAKIFVPQEEEKVK